MPTVVHRSSWSARLIALTGVLSLALVPTAPAWAQELDEPQSDTAAAVDTAPDAAEGFVFGLGDLGLGGSLPLYGTDGRLRVTVPVPEGSAPAALNAVLDLPAWLDRGWIDVDSGERSLTRITLPADQATLPISIPLGAATVAEGAITLDVSSTLIPDAGYCPNVTEDPIRFVDAVVDYSGVPAAPRTISEFLPPVLQQLTVFVPAEPTDDVISATLTLTTSVVAYYGAHTVRVVVRPDTELQAAAPDGPFERSVVLSENTDAGAELIFPGGEQAPPRLFVSGSGSQLLDQTRLVTSNIADLAVATKALAGASAPPAVLAPNSATLDALGIGTVSGTPVASLPIDQTRLGRSAAGLSVHLIGNYTPGAGSITAAVGDTTLAVWPAETTGILDRWIDIPNGELNRITTLDVSVSHPADATSACGAQTSSTVTIDGASVIESSASSSPTPLGFGSLPQALMPQVNVALAENTYANTVRAVSIVDGLQRMSTRPLLPNVVSVGDAVAGSDPAIVVAPDGDLPDSVIVPLSSSGTTTFTIAGGDDGSPATELTLDAAVQFGSVQVTSTEGGAALVIASSNGAPEQLDSVLGWLDSASSRWFGLTGDVVIGTPDMAPLSLSSDRLAAADADVSADSDGLSGLFLGAVVVAVVLFGGGIVAAIVIWLRARRSNRQHRHRGDGSPTS
ncbi:hypothetical protein [Rhodococcoides yunnanense]|uniref:hypothetical protein n=1 Tax=Rhodococcoides yunnanense TaxID=278209 RepID=UPI00093521BA|nr:hypothetical protein [Rhodococcus yunnanensis]